MEAMSEGVATVTEQGLVSYCNARFAAIVGATLERTIGNPIARLVSEADRERFQALITAGNRGRAARASSGSGRPCADRPALVRLAVVSPDA